MIRFRLAFLLALTVAVIYIPLAQYGYVHDDRTMIQSFITSGAPDLSPVAKTFFRPLGSLYCYAVYAVFGANTVGFHVLAVLVLFLTAYLVRLVARALTNDDGVAWTSAFLYAIAATIHLDAQMWMVGVFDNGAVLFALLSLYAFLRDRPLLSALAFALALGFKESAAPMLLVIAAHALFFRTGLRSLGRAWPHLAVFIIWVALKSLGGSPVAGVQVDPYAWSMLGSHVPENFWLYVTWFAPAPILTIAVIIVVGWACFRKPRLGWFLVAWAALMLIMPSLLLHHAFRYYAILALPAIAIGAAVGFYELPVPRQWRTGLVVVAVVANFAVSVAFIQGHVRRGINDDVPAVNDGYNHLLRRSLQEAGD